MNKKTILGISLTAAFAVSMIFTQSAFAGVPIDGFKTIDSTEVTKNNPANTVNVSFNTNGTIPTDGSEGAFGYGLIAGTNDEGQPENVLALTTHLCVSDSFEQGDSGVCGDTVAGLLEALGFPEGSNEAHDDATFHAHVLDLKGIVDTSSCSTVGNNIGLEVDLQRTLQSRNNVSPDYDVDVVDDEITVSDVPRKDIKSSNFKTATYAYFGIVGFADGDTITNLCLTDGITP